MEPTWQSYSEHSLKQVLKYNGKKTIEPNYRINDKLHVNWNAAAVVYWWLSLKQSSEMLHNMLWGLRFFLGPTLMLHYLHIFTELQFHHHSFIMLWKCFKSVVLAHKHSLECRTKHHIKPRSLRACSFGGDRDQNQGSKITWIIVHQRNRWLCDQNGSLFQVFS